MKRVSGSPRAGWEELVEKVGLIYHHGTDGAIYWDEGAHYELTAAEVDTLEAATNELQQMCLTAGQHIIDKRRYREFAIPDAAVPLIERTWNEEPPALYGRMDLAYDGSQPPKLLEYNADTPTALLEAAVVQWYWLKDVFPDADQFNSIHEKMVAKWKDLKDYLKGPLLHLTHLPDMTGEDLMTCSYVEQTAQDAGIATRAVLIGDIGWDHDDGRFVDAAGERIYSIFKLYPWEWLIHEEFAAQLFERGTDMQWIEPAWKMLWSTKALLPILWELFPNHPNLLPAYTHSPRELLDYVKKPMLSREGANITIHRAGSPDITTAGDYGEEGYIFQALAPGTAAGRNAVIGSWLIDGEAAGIGIRESDGPITTNTSRFVPHLFR